MNRTQAIQEFLNSQKQKVDLYKPEMEVQVNVITGEKRDGRVWISDDDRWYSYRIPNVDSVYKDKLQDFPLAKYAEAIGLTGWNWFTKKSEYVGFDVDSALTHKVGLTDDELDNIKLNCKKIPWITLRRSKSGKGFHIYVKFKEPVPTENHAEHAALARSILAQISSLTGLDFNTKADVIGGVLWIWHRNAKENGFELLQQGKDLENIPPHWRDHLTSKTRKKPSFISGEESGNFEKLLQKTKSVTLDSEHILLLQWFAKSKYTWWWDEDNHLLVCHTAALNIAHSELKLRGVFYTDATGKDIYNDYNCFCFPINNGGWTIRRFGIKTKENDYWSLDPSGWRKAFFNRLPDLDIAARLHKGIKAKNGSFSFNQLKDALAALRLLGVNIQLTDEDEILNNRYTLLIPGDKENELVISVERLPTDGYNLTQWAPARGKKWERIVECLVEIKTIEPPDNILRYTTRGNMGFSWFINSRGRWVEENKDNAKSVLLAMGYSRPDIESIFGQSILNDWEITNKPFATEYPGNRQWNVDSIQLSVTPKYGSWDTWELILQHIGKYIEINDWCKKYGIMTGFEYLLHFIGALFQYPEQPLPYLFLYGDQNAGKSILHEALRFLLLNEKGYTRADHALTNPTGFNGELENALICVVEEVNLQANGKALDRIKDWVTGRTIAIRRMHTNTYNVNNITHWIQCANSATYCPILPGDSRINVIYVDKPKLEIPKNKLEENLKLEAPHFLHKILNLKIPDSESRLRIPVLNSDMKLELASINASALARYLDEFCEQEDGYVISFRDFIADFYTYVDERERLLWTERKIAMELGGKFPKGKYGDGGYIHIGNLKHKKGFSKYVSGNRFTRDSENRLRQI